MRPRTTSCVIVMSQVAFLRGEIGPKRGQNSEFEAVFSTCEDKNGSNSLNFHRSASKLIFLERAFNFTSKSTFWARLPLFEQLGGNENADAFSLPLDEKVLTQHFFPTWPVPGAFLVNQLHFLAISIQYPSRWYAWLMCLAVFGGPHRGSTRATKFHSQKRQYFKPNTEEKS